MIRNSFIVRSCTCLILLIFLFVCIIFVHIASRESESKLFHNFYTEAKLLWWIPSNSAVSQGEKCSRYVGSSRIYTSANTSPVTREIYTADYEAAPHMLCLKPWQCFQVIKVSQAYSLSSTLPDEGPFPSFMTQTEKTTWRIWCWQKLKRVWKKAGDWDFCTCMKTIIFLISVPNAMVLRWRNKRPADKKGSDGLIHQYYSTMSGNTLPDFLKGEKGPKNINSLAFFMKIVKAEKREFYYCILILWGLLQFATV